MKIPVKIVSRRKCTETPETNTFIVIINTAPSNNLPFWCHTVIGNNATGTGEDVFYEDGIENFKSMDETWIANEVL